MMPPVRKRRLVLACIIISGTSIAIGLALFALTQNINLYYTPSQIDTGQAPKNQRLRIGGLVKKGSVHYADQGLQVSFVLTDTAHSVKVIYRGILPDLFREGQGIVAQGRVNAQGVLVADQVLAKHGAKYMPPFVKHALKVAQKEPA